MPAADAGQQAIESGRAALAAYAEGLWQEAYTRFAAAESIVHSPVFVLYMARCRRNQGQLLEARELFKNLVREAMPADAPAPWRQAAASAHAELGTLQQNIPSVWIQRSPRSTVQRATIDGQAAELTARGVELELNPGEHLVEVTEADGARIRRVLVLSEGRRRAPLLFSDPPIPERPATGRAPVAHAGLRSARIVGYASLGLGAAGLASGVVAGLIAKNRSNRIKRDLCDANGDCFPGTQADVEAAYDWAAVSTVSFVFGAGFLAAGSGVLLLVPAAKPSHAAVAVRGSF
jgi:hypothetical protein